MNNCTKNLIGIYFFGQVIYIIIMLQERCAGADTISLVAQLLRRSKAHLQSMLLQNKGSVVEDFYAHLVCFAA